MSPARHARRRKRRFIDRKQQIRFALEVGLYALILPMVFLLLAIGAHFSAWMLGLDAEIVHPLLHNYLLFIVHNWWVVLFALVLLGYGSIWFSHKIFGPMYRFESAMLQKRTNSGEQINCKLRKGDYFHDFAQRFEDFLNQTVVTGESPVEGEAKETGDESASSTGRTE